MKPFLSSSSRALGILTCSFFLFSGCNDRTNAAAPEASQPTTNSPAREAWQSTKDSAQSAAASVRTAVGDAWEKSKDATYKQREAVRERMKTAEASLDSKIVEWSAKKDAVAEDARPAVAAAQKEVTEAREVLRQKINALDNATEETWSSVKAELNTAWQRMTTAVSDLTAKLQS
jgi:hypothetical protein